MARLMLDTGVVVDLSQRRGRLAGGDDVAVAALVLAEYWRGVHLDPNRRRAEAQQSFLEDFLTGAPVVDYTTEVAEHHAELLAYTTRAGRPRGQHDLIIAATARATDRTLVTTDARARFDGLSGVEVRVV